MQRNLVYAIGIVLVVILGWMLVPGEAQQGISAAPTKVAVVDMVKLFNNYDRTKKVNARLAKRQNELKAERKKLVDKIGAMRAELANFNPDSKDFYERQKKLFRMSVDLKSLTQVGKEDIKREFRLSTEKIYKEIVDVVGEVAKQTGYELVLYLDAVPIRSDSFPTLLEKIRQRKVIYSSPRIDITRQALDYLNQKYKLRKK